MRKCIATVLFVTLVLLGGQAWGQGPGKRPKGKAPAKKAQAGPVLTQVVIANVLPIPIPPTGAVPLRRGDTLTVRAGLRSNMPALPRDLHLQLFVEREPGKFHKVAEAKLDGRAGATLRWQVGQRFPSGSHRWYVQFAGVQTLKPSRTTPGVFVVPSP
jgi:hypothetical protein